SAARAQQLDDAGAMVEVVPEPFGVEQVQFLFAVACQFAQAPVVEQKPSVLVDHADGGWAKIENFPKLTLLLGDLRFLLCQFGDVVNPQNAFAADEADVATLIGDLHIGQQQMHKFASPGAPNHLFVQNLAAVGSQLL